MEACRYVAVPDPSGWEDICGMVREGRGMGCDVMCCSLLRAQSCGQRGWLGGG